jgi:hypothetical protein
MVPNSQLLLLTTKDLDTPVEWTEQFTSTNKRNLQAPSQLINAKSVPSFGLVLMETFIQEEEMESWSFRKLKEEVFLA